MWPSAAIRPWAATVFIILIPAIPLSLGFSPASFSRKDDLSCVKEYRNDSIRFFRVLVVSQDKGKLYVGAMNNILQFNLSTFPQQPAIKTLPATDENKRKCGIQREDSEVDCQNHIRLIVEQGQDGNSLFVCGTGAFSPTKYSLSSNISSDASDGNADRGTAECPYDPFDNATAVYITNGNPGNISSMYYGTYSDFLKNYPVIFRPALYNSSGVKVYSEKFTDRVSQTWLKSPQFVKSFDVDDEVFFFFRERAVEYVDAEYPNKIYSRVAKVCKEDIGGGSDDGSTKWLSYQKSRLICNVPGESPFYFGDIYDVWSDGSENFYALFYKPDGYFHSSAICKYNKTEIRRTFNGNYKYRDSTGTWTTLPTSMEPNPRPGNCSLHKTRGIFNGLIVEHVIMDENVEPAYGEPIFMKSGVQFLKIVGEKLDNGTVLFAASSNSEVYQIMVRETPPTFETEVAIVYDLSTDDQHPPIWNMQLVNNTLYLGTDESVMELHLNVCSMLRKIEPCLYSGYCKWDGCNSRCVNKHRTITPECQSKVIFLQNVTSSSPLYELLSSSRYRLLPVNITDAKFYVGLYSTLTLDSILSIGDDLKWYFQNGSSESNKVRISKGRRDKKYFTNSEGDLVISNMTIADAGIYTAEIKDKLVKKIHLTEGDSNLKEAWKQEFVDWAQHYHTWKDCSRPYFDSCQSGNYCSNP